MHGVSANTARGVSAVASVLLATGVSVLVNIWTSGWAWPVGAGLAVLVAGQGWLEFRRAAGQDAERGDTQIVADQEAEVVKGDMTGVRSPVRGARVYVRQRLGRVEGGPVVGVDGTRDDSPR
jgi:hypothetical protein